MKSIKETFRSVLANKINVSLTREALNQKFLSVYPLVPTVYVIVLVIFKGFSRDAEEFWININSDWVGNFIEIVPGLRIKIHDLFEFGDANRAYLLGHCYAVAILWPIVGLPLLLLSLVLRVRKNIHVFNPVDLKSTLLAYAGGVSLILLTFFVKPNLEGTNDRYSRILSYHINDVGLIMEIFLVSIAWSISVLLIFTNLSAIAIKLLESINFHKRKR